MGGEDVLAGHQSSAVFLLLDITSITVRSGAFNDQGDCSEEVKIANADSDCEKKEITPVERDVRPQYEKQFRQQNQSLLARVKKPTGSGQ